MTVTVIESRAAIRHEEVAKGLAEAAEFIRQNPDLPLEADGNPLHVSVRHGSDDEKRREVSRIAAILGVRPGYIYGGSTHYAAIRVFSGGVTYQATAISQGYMDEYDALDTYRGCVQPETAVAA